MSFDLQAEGLNGVNFPTAIVAGGGWNPLSDFVLNVSGTALDVATTANVDAVLGQGNIAGCGVMGLGGSGEGSGIVGVAGTSVASPPTPMPLHQGKNVGVFGTGTGSGAAGVLGESDGGPGVLGESQTGPGISGQSQSGVGVSGQGSSGSPGIIGHAGAGTADGVQGFGTGNFSGVAGFGGSNNGTGVFGLGGGSTGPGVRGIGSGGANTASDTPVGVFGQGANGFEGVVGFDSGGRSAGVRGTSNEVNGVGVRGEGNNGPFAIGVIGVSNQGSAGLFFGAVTVHGNFSVVGGAKSAVVAFPDGSHRRLYCVESPECWFEDFGGGQLVKGQAEVQLDPGFSSVVNGDAYHVFITEYENNNALYVTKRTSTGFVVRAKSPAAAGTFSYRIVAKRKDITAPRFEKVTLPPDNFLETASR
ncbi:MAG: hypothetical protein JO076_13460 [Verrucomicrobia bacterium]|nr:hypothetical protein [Verrucomicrobiota bacterium]